MYSPRLTSAFNLSAKGEVAEVSILRSRQVVWHGTQVRGQATFETWN